MLAGLIFRKDPFFCGHDNYDQLVKIAKVRAEAGAGHIKIQDISYDMYDMCITACVLLRSYQSPRYIV